MNFDEFKNFFNEIDYPAGRIGIFNVDINNKGKKYYFEKLKRSGTLNENNCGFGLNHYGWSGLQMPEYKRSIFHDSEDVDVCIERDEFVSSKKIDENTVEIKTKNWSAIITW